VPQATQLTAAPPTPQEYLYDPAGRRDPFKPVFPDVIPAPTEGVNVENLPPLQRFGLTELNLIGVIWGGLGYSAMLQTPDGKGYTVRQGTKVGPNNGVVTSITENAVLVEEHFSDVYGNKQVRRFEKRLHEKEGSP
jgi:type IV pilus assembly protein PilP